MSKPTNNLMYFSAYFICGVELPALWMIVTEAIYNLRESHNCPWTFDTYFTKATTIPANYQCGLKGPRSRTSGKIFGGGNADTAEWPWVVRLNMHEGNGDCKFLM